MEQNVKTIRSFIRPPVQMFYRYSIVDYYFMINFHDFIYFSY